jgi:hypothetical protein
LWSVQSYSDTVQSSQNQYKILLYEYYEILKFSFEYKQRSARAVHMDRSSFFFFLEKSIFFLARENSDSIFFHSVKKKPISKKPSRWNPDSFRKTLDTLLELIY